MSEEIKNPLIESFLKLHEKMVGYGGTNTNEPYQGRSMQRFTAASTTPDSLRVKTEKPKTEVSNKPTTAPVAASAPSSSETKTAATPKIDTKETSLGNQFSLAKYNASTDDNLKRTSSTPNMAAAYAARKSIKSTPAKSTSPVADTMQKTATDAVAAAKGYADAGAEKLQKNIEAGQNYIKDKSKEFLKWLKSEEFKNNFEKNTLNELVGGTYQDQLSPAERARRAQFSAPTKTSVPPRPAMDASPQPQIGSGNVSNVINTSAANKSASALGGFGKVAPDAQGTSAFKAMPSGSGLGATSPEGYIERMKGVEKANPVSPVGTLKGGNLQIGSRGDDVKALQKRLGIDADGIFGPKTAEALRNLQRSSGLTPDGVYGKQSASYLDRRDALTKLRSENPVGAKQMETGTNAVISPSAAVIRPGDNVNMARKLNAEKSAGSIRPGYNTIFGRSNSGEAALQNRENAIKAREQANREQKFKQGIREEDSTNMSNKLIEAFMKLQSLKTSNIFEAAKKVKKLDPVGKEDEDIDNDGDKDKSDSYLHNRRKKIAAAMKEAKDPYGENDGGVYKSPPRPMTPEEKPNAKVGNSKVIKTGPNSSTVTKSTNEEYEQLDELKKGALEKVRNRASGRMMDDPSDEKAYKVEKQASKRLKKITDTEKEEESKRAYKAYKEEVEFSEAELEHFAAILEGPVAPTSYDSNTSFGKGGSRTGTLTDETNLKKKIKEELEQINEISETEASDLIKRARKKFPDNNHPVHDHINKLINAIGDGRNTIPHVKGIKDYLNEEFDYLDEEAKKRGVKAGTKRGSYGPRKSKEEREAAKASGKKEEPTDTGNPTVPHPFHQIRSQRPDSEGNYTVQHDTGSGIISAKIPAGHAAKFHNSYLATEKPRDKEALTHNFLQSAFKLEAPKAKAGISLPKMPAPKS